MKTKHTKEYKGKDALPTQANRIAAEPAQQTQNTSIKTEKTSDSQCVPVGGLTRPLCTLPVKRIESIVKPSIQEGKFDQTKRNETGPSNVSKLS